MTFNTTTKYIGLLFLCLFLILFTSGTTRKSKKKNSKSVKKVKLYQPVFGHPPVAIVYKTKADYIQNVPLGLSEDKKEIYSYLHPLDLGTNGKNFTPQKLEKGYLLDRQGITKNSAFLKYKYSEYVKQKSAPKLDTLMVNIIEKDPFLEIWDCGCKNRYTNITTQINDIILADSLKSKCRPIYLKGT